jgi:hypothetical protein
MNSGFYEAIVIGVIGMMITVSVIKFMKVFYSSPLKSVQLIRLNKNSVRVFIIFLSMNFIFLLGYLLQYFNFLDNSDLLAILVYALGTSFFFLSLARILSTKYKMN